MPTSSTFTRGAVSEKEASCPHQTDALPSTYLFQHRDIPSEIVSAIFSRMGNCALHPAKRNGSYTGPVLQDGPKWVVQSIGLERKTAIVHRKADLHLVGNLQWRSTNKRLHGVTVQIHYRDGAAKTFPCRSKRQTERAHDPARRIPSSKGIER